MTGLADPQSERAKVDPETLVLRGRPVPAIRFRRSVIVSLAGAAALLVAAAAWLAFEPRGKGAAIREADDFSFAVRPPAGALDGAPSSYAEVPQLAPPFAEQRPGPELGDPPPVDAAFSAPRDAAGDRADAERHRVETEMRAARESGVMVALGRGSARAPTSGGDEEGRVPSQLLDEHLPGRGQNNIQSISEPETPPSPAVLLAGSIISASLITGLDSELSGVVTAQVTQHVFDSLTGHHLLIPQGSRLIGEYDTRVARGQSRAFVSWSRIIRPDGSAIPIDPMPAADTQGYAGLADRVDRHGGELLKGVALATLLGVAAEAGYDGDDDFARAVRDAAQKTALQAGDQLVARSLDIRPTIKVRPGWPLRVIVTKDIMIDAQ